MLDEHDDIQPDHSRWFTHRKSFQGTDNLLKRWQERVSTPVIMNNRSPEDFVGASIDSVLSETANDLVVLGVRDYDLIYGTNVSVYRGNSIQFATRDGWTDKCAVSGKQFTADFSYFEVLIGVRGRNKTMNELVLEDSIRAQLDEEDDWRRQMAEYEASGHTSSHVDTSVPAWAIKESLVEAPNLIAEASTPVIDPPNPIVEVPRPPPPSLPTIPPEPPQPTGWRSHFAIKQMDFTPTITVGLVVRPFPGFYMPGRAPNSVALVISKSGQVFVTYASDVDGYQQGVWKLDMTCGEGDVVGVGFSKENNAAFFTVNGNLCRIPQQQAQFQSKVYSWLVSKRLDEDLEMQSTSFRYLLPIMLVSKGQSIYPAVGARGPAMVLANVTGNFQASWLTPETDFTQLTAQLQASNPPSYAVESSDFSPEYCE